MPGIFGYVGGDAAIGEKLSQAAEGVWGPLEWPTFPGGSVGAHAHQGSALRRHPDGGLELVDGDRALYHGVVDMDCPGTRVRIRTTGELAIEADVSGAFPMYYASLGNGVAFSSLQRVLAEALRADRDIVGCVEAMRFGASLAGRSCFKGISRLLPGQVLRVKRGGVARVEETSRLWTEDLDLDLDDAADRAWGTLLRATAGASPGNGGVALMMSAGWDSRTLLALLDAAGLGPRLACYTHGDLDSREVRLAREIVRSRGHSHLTEPIDARIFDKALSDEAFRRTECAIFAHWHRAGSVLRDHGFDVAVSGVYGGLIGGHYGPASTLQSRQKMLAVLGHLMGLESSGIKDSDDVRRLLYVRESEVPWYLNQDLMAPKEYCREINGDVEIALDRLGARGVLGPDRLLEAFLVEFRGAQYMNGQNLSLRAYLDVANPFAARPTLELASGMRQRLKIHNRINRQMLMRQAPDLVRWPMAATLVSARQPLLFQEASRLARKLAESTWRKWDPRSRPRLGWVDFRFMREDDLLSAIVDELRSDLWSKDTITERSQRLRNAPDGANLHPFFDQIGKLLTVERIQL